MPITITFTTDSLTKDEALGLFALLDTVHPDAFADHGESDTAPTPEWTGVIIQKRAEPVTISEESETPYERAAPDVLASAAGTVEEAVPVQEQPTPDTPSAPERDSSGLPWNEEIHASTRATNADGTWRYKRGVDKGRVAEVEASMRHESNLSATDSALIAQAVAADVDNADFSDTVTEVVATPRLLTMAPPPPPGTGNTPPPAAPPAPVVQTSPVPEVAQASVGQTPFVALFNRVTTAQRDKGLTTGRVKELLESIGKKGMMDLRTDDDALAAFSMLLDEELA